MYFPSGMNFQYFFFSTYPGYFLQALPVALLAGAVYGVYKARKAPGASMGKIIPASLFVCYLTGLFCLTLLETAMGDIYYYLFYHMPSGRIYRWFTFQYDFIPDFFYRFSAENVGNILMYLPFGILYPLFRENASWKRTVAAGLAVSVGIELLQPVFGRSFDINDILLNGAGILVSTAVFYMFAHRK